MDADRVWPADALLLALELRIPSFRLAGDEMECRRMPRNHGDGALEGQASGEFSGELFGEGDLLLRCQVGTTGTIRFGDALVAARKC